MNDPDSTDEIIAQAQVMIARLRALLQASDELRRQHGPAVLGAASGPAESAALLPPAAEEP